MRRAHPALSFRLAWVPPPLPSPPRETSHHAPSPLSPATAALPGRAPERVRAPRAPFLPRARAVASRRALRGDRIRVEELDVGRAGAPPAGAAGCHGYVR